MRFVYVDIDTLRPDHLGLLRLRPADQPGHRRPGRRGAYASHDVYASDTPCLPSRTALSTGQFGIRNGAVNHGGAATDPFPEGASSTVPNGRRPATAG